jgi:CubicO group peptidase (beta-lactamase class C family)
VDVATLRLPIRLPGHAEPRRASLAERMAETQTPGLAVAVIDGGDLAWAGGFGVLEAGKAAPVTPDTIFQVCSVSKHAAMVGALRLVQEGRLDLDEDVNRRLTSWRLPPSGGWPPRVTVRHLLGHTAGLTQNWYRGFWRDEPAPTLLQVLEGEPPANTPPVRATLLPGSRFRYSGSHYSVLQQLMIDVVGQPFPELMRELVFEPLAMRDSSYDQAFPERHGSVAVGHYTGAQPLRGGWRVLPEMAGAGLWSSAPDLARLALELQRARRGGPTAVLRPETAAEAFRPGPGGEYGLGMALWGEGDGRTFGHGGDNIGYKCRSVAYRERGLGGVVLTNGDDGWMVVDDVLSGVAEHQGWPGFDARPATLDRLPDGAAGHVGAYALRDDYTLRVTLEGGRLLLHAPDQAPLPLLPTGPAAYVTAPLDLAVTFADDALELDGQRAPRLATPSSAG